MSPLAEVVPVSGGWTVRLAFGRHAAQVIRATSEVEAFLCARYLERSSAMMWAVLEAHAPAVLS